MILRKLSAITRARLRATVGHRTYSQEGEDRILLRLFEHQKSGFYVDVGAHHPNRFSNTYLFYRMGWRGINIDAMPGSMALFRTLRPRDTNIEIGIGRERGSATFFVFDEPALNTFDEALAKSRDGAHSKLVRTIAIVTRPLREVLSENVAPDQPIDFMNVDVEGLDGEVLASNDWARFRPKIVLVETLGSSIDTMESDDSVKILRSLKYELLSKTVHTSLFIDRVSG